MMSFSNQQPQPTTEEAKELWKKEVLVYRPWQPDELKEVAGSSDPQKTGGVSDGPM